MKDNHTNQESRDDLKESVVTQDEQCKHALQNGSVSAYEYFCQDTGLDFANDTRPKKARIGFVFK